MGFLSILCINRMANAGITCMLQQHKTSDFSGWSIPDSRFSIFEHFHWTSHGGLSSFSLDASKIFHQAETIESLTGIEGLNTHVLVTDKGDHIGSDHFLDSVRRSESHYSIENSGSAADVIVCLPTDFITNESSSDPAFFVPFNSQNGIPDIRNDIIDIVPLPSAFIMGGLGLGMVGWLRRHRMF